MDLRHESSDISNLFSNSLPYKISIDPLETTQTTDVLLILSYFQFLLNGTKELIELLKLMISSGSPETRHDFSVLFAAHEI